MRRSVPDGPMQPGPDHKRSLSNESGVTLIAVGLWLMVIFGFAAYALDTSRIFNEYAELQNGADAAALAVASDCGLGLCNMFYDAYGVAETYADANVLDGTAWAEDVDIDLANQTVTVDVKTEDAAGDNDFDMVLAQVLGKNEAVIAATATATWGAPSAFSSLPVTFSKCEWDAFGAPGFVDEDPNGFLHRPSAVKQDRLPPATGYPYEDRIVTIYLHGVSTCGGSPSGQDLPGGFGWTDPTSGCTLESQLGTWVEVDPGASPPSGCSVSDMADKLGTVQFIPYFNDVVGTGTNAEYHVHGFGALYVTGYNFGGSYKEDSLVDGQPPCTGNERCIQGYLIGDWVDSGNSRAGLGGGDYGVVSIELSN